MFSVPSSQPVLAGITSSFAPGLLERHLAEMNPWLHADPFLTQTSDLASPLRHPPADSPLQAGILASSGLASSALAQPTHTLSAPTRQLTIGPPSLHPGLPHVSVAAQTQPEIPPVPKSGLHQSACMGLSSAHVACMAVPATNDETRRRLLSRELRRLKEVRQLLGHDRRYEPGFAGAVSTLLGPPSDTAEPAAAAAAAAAASAELPRPQPPPPPPPLPAQAPSQHQANMSLLQQHPQTRPLQTPTSQPESTEPLSFALSRPPPTPALRQSAQGPQQNKLQVSFPPEGQPQFLQYAQEAINAAQEVTRLTQKLERTQQELETARRSVATLAARFGGMMPHLTVGEASEGMSTSPNVSTQSDAPVQHFVHCQESVPLTTEATTKPTTFEQASGQHASEHALTTAQMRMQNVITANLGNDPTASAQARNFIEQHSNPASLATMMQHVKMLLEYQQAIASLPSAPDDEVAEVPPESRALAASSAAENPSSHLVSAEAAKHAKPVGDELAPGVVRTAEPPAMAPDTAASEPETANHASSLGGCSLIPTFRRPLSLYPATDATTDAETRRVEPSEGTDEAIPANKGADSDAVGVKQATSPPASRRGCWRRTSAHSTISNRACKRRATEFAEVVEDHADSEAKPEGDDEPDGFAEPNFEDQADSEEKPEGGPKMRSMAAAFKATEGLLSLSLRKG